MNVSLEIVVVKKEIVTIFLVFQGLYFDEKPICKHRQRPANVSAPEYILQNPLRFKYLLEVPNEATEVRLSPVGRQT